MNKILNVLQKIWSSTIAVVEFIFANNTIKTVGTGIHQLLSSAFRYLGISQQKAKFVLIGLSALLAYGVYTSVISVIKLEGFIVFPAIWGLIKLALFLSFMHSWSLFNQNSNLKKRKPMDATLKQNGTRP